MSHSNVDVLHIEIAERVVNLKFDNGSFLCIVDVLVKADLHLTEATTATEAIDVLTDVL